MKVKHKLEISESVTAIILAGGFSSRMKFPKVWLKTNSGKTFLETLSETILRSGITRQIVVLNASFNTESFTNQIRFKSNQARIISNSHTANGRLYSIKIGLDTISDSDFVLIQNIDSPEIKSDTIQKLVAAREKNAVCIPTFSGKKGHPVLVDFRLLCKIISEADEMDTLKDVLSKFKKILVPVADSGITQNINTPNEYEKMMHEYMA